MRQTLQSNARTKCKIEISNQSTHCEVVLIAREWRVCPLRRRDSPRPPLPAARQCDTSLRRHAVYRPSTSEGHRGPRAARNASHRCRHFGIELLKAPKLQLTEVLRIADAAPKKLGGNRYFRARTRVAQTRRACATASRSFFLPPHNSSGERMRRFCLSTFETRVHLTSHDVRRPVKTLSTHIPPQQQNKGPGTQVEPAEGT